MLVKTPAPGTVSVTSGIMLPLRVDALLNTWTLLPALSTTNIRSLAVLTNTS